MPAGFAADPGKPEMQVAAFQIPVNDVLYIRPEKTVLALITVLPHNFKVFEMILHALKVVDTLRIARLVDMKCRFFDSRKH